MKPERVRIFGVPLDCVTMEEAVDYADEIIQNSNSAESVIAVNPEKIIKAHQDESLLNRLNKSGLLIPDGIGAVIAAKLFGLSQTISRVPGSELMPELCNLAANKNYSVFLYGANDEVNQQACENLLKLYPNLNIAGRQHGFVSEAEMAGLIDKINLSKAQILFIALGSPRQEMWMDKYMPQLEHVRICQGVGGTFDVIAGNVKRAPLLFRKLHLEWFYRLACQPKRILRQKALPLFAWKVVCHKASTVF